MIVRVGLKEGDFLGETGAALQAALDAVGLYGGGTVEVGPGTYILENSLRVWRNTRLVGSGPEKTVLRKSDGVRTEFAVDADYGQKKVTARDARGFRVGMGVVVTDDKRGGWLTTVATVTLVQGDTVFVDTEFLMDYAQDRGGAIYNAFPPIAGVDVDSVAIEGLSVDGNREKNWPINGCVGGGIYLHRARRCRIADCVVRDFAGDGISFQTTQDITVERCQVINSTGLGFHPGTGSARPVVRHCVSRENDSDGLFLCWRVQDGVFEGNQIMGNGGYGVSIGHKDTDNLFVSNTVRDNASHGIYFRDEKPTNTGSRNTFRMNVVEDNGGCGIRVEGQTTDLLFEENIIRDTREGAERTQQIGISAGEQAERVRAVRNRLQNLSGAEVEGAVEVES